MPVAPEIQELERRISALPKRKRLAFVAAAAERAVPVHQFDRYASSDSLKRAVDLIWKAALGDTVSAAAIGAADRAIAKAMPESAEDEPGFSATVFSGVAVQNGLEAIKDNTPMSAIRVSRGEYDGYEVLGDAPARDHEVKWQNDAVSLLERSSEDDLSRDMFSASAPPPTHFFPA